MLTNASLAFPPPEEFRTPVVVLIWVGKTPQDFHLDQIIDLEVE